MVDDVKDITEKAESKEALDRARLARERREAEQRKRLDELRAHAAAAQAQRERRDEERRRRQAEQRARDDDRRQQEVISEHTGPITNGKVEERKRAIWEASISRREALLQRERDRTERLERARAARSAPRPAFAFGSSTPRLLEPVDSAGFFWAARSTNPIDQMNFFESLAASTTNVMYASAPLTRRASALQLDSDTENKAARGLMFSSFHEADRSPQAVMWSSVARRRTDLVPTVPASRAPGRAYSMTRLDKLPGTPSPSTHHLNRSQTRSGETTPGSRPGSAMSNAGVVRRANSAPRKPRPASIAGTGCNTPRAEGAASATSTPAVSRDASTVARPATTPRRPRPLSLHVTKPATPLGPGEGKPPLHRKPKSAKDQEKGRGKSLSSSPGRALSPSPAHTKDDKEHDKSVTSERRHVDAQEVTQKLEALQGDSHIENKENIEVNIETTVENKEPENRTDIKIEVQKPEEKEIQKPEKEIQKPEKEKNEQKIEQKNEQKEQKETKETQKIEKKESSVEKTEENEMTASMISRRITTEEEAKAALAERRRRAREELERQAELERLRLQREAEEEAERQRQEEERQRREEEEARELAALQRAMQEEKLRKAIEAQQQLEREEAERKAKEEQERAARLKEEEEKRRAAEEAERVRREELEREEKERLARKQRVEAIMARTRLKKQAEEDKKKQEQKTNQNEPQNNQPAQENKKPETETNNKTETNTETVTNTPDIVQDTKVNETVSDTKVNESVSDTKVNEVTENVNVDNKVVDATNTDSHSETVKVAGIDLSFVNDSNVGKMEKGEVMDNGNVQTADLLSLATSQPESKVGGAPWASNGNLNADLLGLDDNKHNEKPTGETKQQPENGNIDAHISDAFLRTERVSEQSQQDDFAAHNGHGLHPLTLQNAI